MGAVHSRSGCIQGVAKAADPPPPMTDNNNYLFHKVVGNFVSFEKKY